MAGNQFTELPPIFAVAHRQCLLRPGDRHVKQPPFLVQRPLGLGARMRDQPVLHAGNVHVRKLESLATVHGDQRHRVAGFVVVVAFAVERNVFEKTVQPFRHRTISRDKTRIHRVEQIDDVAHAVLGGFLVLLHAPNLAEQTHLIQPSGTPHLERVRRLNGDRAVQPLVDRVHQLNKVEDAVHSALLKLAKR